ncbi:hypothetical protein MIMGU_mgv11b024075mg [Erythranthe guttata]|uniref:Uncharacterized protein n=1 Tax=Erythranthe guttata TaxID=4155 RepID=A0A022RX51_ERYGU|nr:hypothetical protein MIMGU_mgv11b024075mg [Erythranthe guttata]
MTRRKIMELEKVSLVVQKIATPVRIQTAGMRMRWTTVTLRSRNKRKKLTQAMRNQIRIRKTGFRRNHLQQTTPKLQM